MNIKKHIPNFLTCCNLLCGCIGITYALTGIGINGLLLASYLIFAACIFDFLDGFAARLLKVTSPIGKELDSLADVVTFGVLPGVIIFRLIEISLQPYFISFYSKGLAEIPSDNFILNYEYYIKAAAFIIPVFSALRLAKFNIDTRQTDSFIGVPTPTNAILIASIPLIIHLRVGEISEGWTIYPPLSVLVDPIMTQSNYVNDPLTNFILNPIFLIIFSIIMSLLLVAELPLFALKFKNFSWADNKMKYILLASSVVLLILLQWAAIPLIIFLYILLSVIEHKLLKAKS